MENRPGQDRGQVKEEGQPHPAGVRRTQRPALEREELRVGSSDSPETFYALENPAHHEAHSGGEESKDKRVLI